MIAYVTQDVNSVKVYDEGNHLRFVYTGELVGYTNTTVSVKRGTQTQVYDEQGHTIRVF